MVKFEQNAVEKRAGQFPDIVWNRRSIGVNFACRTRLKSLVLVETLKCPPTRKNEPRGRQVGGVRAASGGRALAVAPLRSAHRREELVDFEPEVVEAARCGTVGLELRRTC